MFGMISICKSDFEPSAGSDIKIGFQSPAAGIRSKPFQNNGRISPGSPQIFYGSMNDGINGYGPFVSFLYRVQ